MNLKDPYYERIIYKKNAVTDLSGILNNDFENKKVFFLSGKTPYKKFGTFVVNEINRAGAEFVFKFVDDNLNRNELEELIGEAKKCNVVVALGGGSVCDTAKYISKIAELKYIMIVTYPSTSAYFTPYAFVPNDSLCDIEACGYAHKILIDENFIIKSNDEGFESGKKYVLSFWEVVLNLEINNLLFEKKYSSCDLKLLLAKFKDNLPTMNSNKSEGKLLLMDILVDLGKILCDLDMSFWSGIFLSMLLKFSGAIKTTSFGSLTQTATKILFESYKKFFGLKKIDIYTFLDLESLANSLSYMKINVNMIKIKNIKNIRQNKQLFLKINAVKNQISCLIAKCYEEITFEGTKKENGLVDLSKCIMSFNILPYVYDCSCVTNLLSSSGLISWW